MADEDRTELDIKENEIKRQAFRCGVLFDFMCFGGLYIDKHKKERWFKHSCQHAESVHQDVFVCFCRSLYSTSEIVSLFEALKGFLEGIRFLISPHPVTQVHTAKNARAFWVMLDGCLLVQVKRPKSM